LRDGSEEHTGKESHGGDYNPRMRLSLLFAAVMGAGLSGQIATDLVDKHKADFHTQATEKDLKVNNDVNAVAASKLLKGPNGVTVVAGATHALSAPAAFEMAVEAAAAWFQKYL
jgi:uncharacterized protein (DUF2344 family)